MNMGNKKDSDKDLSANDLILEGYKAEWKRFRQIFKQIHKSKDPEKRKSALLNLIQSPSISNESLLFIIKKDKLFDRAVRVEALGKLLSGRGRLIYLGLLYADELIEILEKLPNEPQMKLGEKMVDVISSNPINYDDIVTMAENRGISNELRIYAGRKAIKIAKEFKNSLKELSLLVNNKNIPLEVRKYVKSILAKVKEKAKLPHSRPNTPKHIIGGQEHSDEKSMKPPNKPSNLGNKGRRKRKNSMH